VIKVVAEITEHVEALLAFYDYPAEQWIHLRTTNPIESATSPLACRQRPHLVALVREGARFEKGASRPSPGYESTRFFPATAPRPTLTAVRQILLRAIVLLGSWAIGLLVAAWVVPGVSLSVSGFIVAVVVFSVSQAILSLLILKLPHGYASLLLGGAGLVLTIVALSLASVLTHGLTIRGMASWVATTVVVWLVTTVGAISLPELLARDDVGST
jgi:hypothetical protein